MFASWFLSGILNADSKFEQQQFESCDEHMELSKQDIDTLFYSIMTDDETLVHHCNLETEHRPSSGSTGEAYKFIVSRNLLTRLWPQPPTFHSKVQLASSDRSLFR